MYSICTPFSSTFKGSLLGLRSLPSGWTSTTNNAMLSHLSVLSNVLVDMLACRGPCAWLSTVIPVFLAAPVPRRQHCCCPLLVWPSLLFQVAHIYCPSPMGISVGEKCYPGFLVIIGHIPLFRGQATSVWGWLRARVLKSDCLGSNSSPTIYQLCSLRPVI